MKKIVAKHSRAIRWFHWINFPLLMFMIWSGLWIYWANDVYRIGWGNFTLFPFFPNGFYDFFHTAHHLADGMAWHFLGMWIFAANGLLYVAYLLGSGEWRHLWPSSHSLREAWRVLLHDLHLSKKTVQVPGKFNGAQKIAYTLVIFMGAGSLVTGLAIYKPVLFSGLTWLCGGYRAARAEHFALTVGFVLFFGVHILQVIRAGWNNFQSMISGDEIQDDHP